MIEDTRMNINAYLDGELGPEDAADVEALLETDPDTRAQFNALVRQKDHLIGVVGALDARPQNFETARLERLLATALIKRSAKRGLTGFGA